MYQVSLYNNGIETIINYASVDYDAPHLNSLPLKEGLSLIDSLSFILNQNNPGYDKVFELSTKIKVIDLQDNSVRFTGRVLDIQENMNSEGLFYKDIMCEGSLGYLNDTKQRNNLFENLTAKDFLTQILATHNSKVDATKQIQVGNVNVVANITHKCDFKSTLKEILEVKNNVGGDILIRENSGILFLDWLDSFSGNNIEVRIGLNMKDMVKSKDISNIGTRIIPLGANNLTISSINGGLDYIEDAEARATFGVIEKTVEYRDIEDPNILKNICMEDLKKYTQPLYLLETNALDLSYLTHVTEDKFRIGTDLHIINPIMNIDDVYKIYRLEVDLLQPYNPKLTIANFQTNLSTILNDSNKNNMKNNGVYNNVQIGDSSGVRAVREDGKVTTTLNAKDGISITNDRGKVFYVDSAGNLVANDGTFNDIVSNNMIANLMRTSNTSTYIILHDQYVEFFKNGLKIMELGFDSTLGLAAVKLFTEDGATNGITISGGGSLGVLGSMHVDSTFNLYGDAYYKGSEIATKADLAATIGGGV